MATIGTLKNLMDWGKELDPDGSTAVVAELLSQYNGIVKTAQFMEGNLPTGEREAPLEDAGGVFAAHNVVNKATEMGDFLTTVRTHPGLRSAIVSPSGEGISVSVKPGQMQAV